MRRVIKTILLTVLVQSVYGQEVTTQSIDSLFHSIQGSRIKHPDSAIALSNEVRIWSEELKYKWGVIQSKLIKGLAFYQKNKLDDAAKILIEVINDASEMKEESFEEARARTVLGLIYQRINNFKRAEENFRKSAEMFKTLGNTLRYTMAMNNIGTTHGMRGEYPEALSVFMQVREIALGDQLPKEQAQSRLGKALTNISHVYSLMGDSEKALKFAKKALKIKLTLEDPYSIAYSYSSIGEIFKSDAKWDSALYYLNLTTNSEVRDAPRFIPIIVAVKQKIASIYAKQGKLDLAMSELHASMEMRKANENYGIEDVYNLLAQYHLDLNQPDSARFYSRRALKMAQSNSAKRTARGAAKRLTELFMESGRYDSAFHYKSLYHAYSDSIFNESNERKFNNLRIDLETSEKQQEIVTLRKQQAIDQANRIVLIVSVISITIISISTIVLLMYRHKNKQKRQKIKEMELNQAIEKREIQLQQQTLHMINLNNNLADVEGNLKKIKKQELVSGRDVQRVLSNIMVNKSMEKEWQQFEDYFSKIHPTFYRNLVRKHEKLTQQERRLTALIKMDLSNREIAGILNIEQRSVIMNRYRLKRKLGLEECEDLEVYIRRF